MYVKHYDFALKSVTVFAVGSDGSLRELFKIYPAIPSGDVSAHDAADAWIREQANPPAVRDAWARAFGCAR